MRLPWGAECVCVWCAAGPTSSFPCSSSSCTAVAADSLLPLNVGAHSDTTPSPSAEYVEGQEDKASPRPSASVVDLVVPYPLRRDQAAALQCMAAAYHIPVRVVDLQSAPELE